jgi:hypothetical protein
MGTFRSNAAQSVYASPNEYNLAMSLLAALALARAATAPSLRRVGLALLFVAAAVVSLRLKAVLSVGAVFALVVAVQMLQGRRGALALALVGALCLGAVVAGEGRVIRRQVAVYAGSNESARAALYRAGTHIAEQRFPLGAGFGRFGTAPSRNPYSTVYDEEGVSDVWGLSRRFDRFVADTSWPAVLGETGISGLLVWIAGLAMLGALAVRRLREDGGFAPLALLGVLVVIVVDSSGDSTLFSWNTITTLALVVAATLAGARSRPA